jgi:hypothetical protein
MKNSIKYPVMALIILLIVSIAGIVVSAIGLPSAIRNVFFNDKNERTSIENAIKAMEELYPTDIILYGNDIYFKTKPDYRRVESLNKETLAGDKKYSYTVVIINDLDNSINLDADTITLLKQSMGNDGFSLIYLGERYKTTWDAPGLPIAYSEGNLCYMYYSVGGKQKENIGAWKKSDQESLKQYPNMLGDVIIYNIEYYLQEANNEGLD